MREFLGKWYCEKGPSWCAERLGRKVENVKQMAHTMGLNYRTARQERIRRYLSDRLLLDGWKGASEVLRLSDGKVRLWAKKLGIDGPPDDRGNSPTELLNEQEKAVLTGYPEKSPWELAKETGLTGDIVIGFLKRRGLYQGFDRRASRVVNKEFFRWSNDFAYVLGYMYADGSVGEYEKIDSDSHSVRKLTYSSITSKDEQILRDIGERMRLRSKPKSHWRKKSQFSDEIRMYWCLTTSCRWVYDRWLEYGLKPRKSFDGMDVPKVPDKFMNHFVRGFFDGDGYRTNDGYGVRFGGTDRVFMEWLRDVVMRVVGGEMPKISVMENSTRFFSFSIYADRAKKLYEWMAPEESDLRLERKWAKKI